MNRFEPPARRNTGNPIACVFAFALLLLSFGARALQPLDVDGQENGLRLDGHFEIWHDERGDKGLQTALQSLRAGQYGALQSRDSTGLKPGAFWSHFSLRNISGEAITLHLEYVDHQLIHLTAFQRSADSDRFETVADLALDRPFSERPVPHHRFVVPVTIAAGEIHDFLFRFSSDGHGFVFPNLRIWSPDLLRSSQAIELAVSGFFTGSLLLMTIIVIVGGVATGNMLFYAYSIYALTKIVLWPTIFGFTHQFFLQEGFHWRLMSLSAALTLLAGIWFARQFLQTRRFTRRLDYVLLVMQANAGLLFVAALLKLTTLSVLSTTAALLMSPIMAVAGLIRWRQGSRGAAVFTLAWTFLMLGLFLQALRDLGLVAHNFVNYYWPAVASYSEMVVIVAAIGISLWELRRKKEAVERLHRQHLENAREKLQQMVSDRTRELEIEKKAAEREARTDALTGINNRRSFLRQAEILLEHSRQHGSAFNLIMMDIDHFKKVNDSHGHQVGDSVLRAFADAIKAHIREDDVFGRIGGEEFALALEGSTDTALNTARRLREAVSDLCIDTAQSELRITASIGVSSLERETHLEPLMKRADDALYEAKRSGRNNVVLAGAI